MNRLQAANIADSLPRGGCALELFYYKASVLGFFRGLVVVSGMKIGRSGGMSAPHFRTQGFTEREYKEWFSAIKPAHKLALISWTVGAAIAFSRNAPERQDDIREALKRGYRALSPKEEAVGLKSETRAKPVNGAGQNVDLNA